MTLPTLSPRDAKIHLSVTIPLLALFAYNAFLTNIYDFGLQQLSAERFALFVFWSLSSLACLPDRVEKPSDVFWSFYLFLCGIWGATLWGLTSGVTLSGGLLWLVLLHAPAYAFRGLALLAPLLGERIPLIQIASSRWMIAPFLLVLVVGVLATLGAGEIGSFDFLSLYDRRLAGREVILERSIEAYLFGMAVNGVAVMLAFMAGRHRSVIAAVASLLFCLYAYWLLGLRSQFLNLVLLFTFGIVVAQNWTARLQAVLVWGTFAAMAVFLLEFWTTGYSQFADYVIRRISMVQPEVQSFYMKAMLSNPLQTFLHGVDWRSYSDVTYFIGDTYLLNPDANANTNGFFYALAKFGLSGYLLAIAVVSGLLLVVDNYYRRTGTSEFLAVAALYGILVAEQSYSAALFSSGIVPCIVIIALFSRPEQGKPAGP
jgi:hypothetical protein